MQSVWVFSVVDYEPPHYTRSDGTKYLYPLWAEAIGWSIASVSLVCIPAFAIYVLVRSEGTTLLQVIILTTRSAVVISQ